MPYWVFNTKEDAEAAQAVCFAMLPADTLMDGTVAPEQITERWDNIVETTDGRYGFRAFTPKLAVTMTDEDFENINPDVLFRAPYPE